MRMGAQGLNRIVAAGKLGLGQGGMDLIVADLMQQHCRPAFPATQFRDQVVQALFGIRRNRAITKRAKGPVIHAA